MINSEKDSDTPDYRMRAYAAERLTKAGDIFIPEGDALIHVKGEALNWLEDIDSGELMSNEEGIELIDRISENEAIVARDQFEEVLGQIYAAKFFSYLESANSVTPPRPTSGHNR